MNNENKVMQWLRLGCRNSVLLKIEMPDGSFAVGINGLTPSDSEWQKLVSINGFQPSASGRLLMRHKPVSLSEMRQVFPFCSVDAKYPVERVYVRRNHVVDRAILPDTQASILIGKNYLGNNVYTTATGTRFIVGEGKDPISEESISIAPYFLRMKNKDDIDFCADGFVLRLADGENLRPIDIRKFCATIYGEESVEETDSRLRGVQEAIEAAIFRNIYREFVTHGDIKKSFKWACGLTDRQPVMEFRTSESIALQQYSTPATLSIAAQNALGNLDGAELLEPTIGNASLVSMFSGATKVTGIEIDENRVARAKKIFSSEESLSGSSINIYHGDFTEMDIEEGRYDAIVSNPPFGGLSKPVIINGLNITRIDHLILIRSLESRKDNGKAVYIIAADRENIYKADEGIIMEGGSRNLFNWLADHYEFEAVEISGSMYRKQGAGYPVRMIAVGRKYTADEAAAARKNKTYRIDSMSVVHNNEELWAASESMRNYFDLAETSYKASEAKNADAAAPAIKAVEVAPIEAAPVIVSDKAANEPTEDPTFGNEYQAQYQSMSSGESSAMIPKNLSVPQSIAFDNFIKEHGDPEEFVRRELKIDDLNAIVPDSPEQIDAIAMAIANMKRGRALILTDQTGMGKGRIVAAVARWSALNSHPVIFLTEKSSLFSDFWRDIRDIGSDDVFQTFILNDDVSVLSTDSAEGGAQSVLIQKTSKATRKRVMDAGNLQDEGFNLMMATYSQFNRNEAVSAKSAFIKSAAEGATLILDESHNAAGDSNTGINISQAVQMSRSAAYSSATYAKNASNMGVYYRAFPNTVDMQSLSDTLAVGGEPLQEVLSSMLCEDGVLMRREHDLSNLKFTTINVSEEILARNIRVSDRISDILAKMAYLSGDVESVAKKANEKYAESMKAMNNVVRDGNRMGVSYTNFGSRLHNISRQFALSLTADTVIADALSALRNGQKPVIVLEQTMESIMNEISASMGDDASGEIKDIEGIDSATESIKQVYQDPITIKLLLNRLLGKLTTVTRNNGYGVSERVSVFEVSETNNEKVAVSNYIAAVQDDIDSIEDDLLVMPLDQIRDALVKEGYSCGEVSGRSSTFEFADKGVIRNDRKNDNSAKLSEIFKFNSGESDAVIITRSGCTGISMHASEKFADRRQRVLIEAQIANNVAERVQFFGRVNRRGQVSSPEIHSITSGLPWENRLLAMQNMKMRKLTANTQSNRDSSAQMKGIPDLLNEIGDAVCKDFLMNNPEVTRRLAINPDGSEDSMADFFFVNKLTGLMCLLPYRDQVNIYEELTSEYQVKLADLENKGINPLESKILNVKATVTKRIELLSGVEGSDSVFDAPVFAEKIEWQEDIEPIRSKAVLERANRSIEALTKIKGFGKENPKTWEFYSRRAVKDLNGIDASGFIEVVKAGFLRAMEISIPDRFLNPDLPDRGLAAALADNNPNAPKRLQSRWEWFMANAKFLMPGDTLTATVNDEPTECVIVDVNPPEEGKEHYLGKWDIRIVPIGKDVIIPLTYNSLIDDVNFKSHDMVLSEAIKKLDDAPAGHINFSRWTLTGNLFRAAEMAAKSAIGRSGIYTTQDGGRHRAIICRSIVSLDSLMSMDVALSETDALEYVETMFSNERTGKIEIGPDIALFWYDYGDNFRITTPGSKNRGGQIFLNQALIEITGEFAGSRSIMSASFGRPDSMENMIRLLYAAKCSISKSVRNTEILNKEIEINKNNAL